MARPLKVAVIGAGVAGLTTARYLKSEGHQVVVYEKSDQIGGIWVYNPEIESDPLGIDPNRKIVHGSLYNSLTTNLPRPLMRFSDYPFIVKNKDGELMDFPGHEEVLIFLNNFARDFGILELVRLNCEVVRVELKNDDEWMVESRLNGGLNCSEEIFEAVVVCNGHNTQPRVADLPGINNWKGKQIHCHNYRVPGPFRDQVVVIIGGASSANDISLEIAEVAKEVHLSSRFPEIEVKKWETYDNLWQHSKVEYCYENGEISFQDGALVAADIIIHCTGYNYYLPFLKSNGIITVDDNRVGPLYKHVFPPKLAPTLSFVGITRVAINFIMIDLQAKWVASALSGKVILPSEEEMLADVEQYYQFMEENGVPKHHTHTLDLHMHEYLDWLAAQVGLPPVEKQLKEIFYKIREILPTSWVKFRGKLLEEMPWITTIL
ncbi:hypothetical protein ACH5RR_000358 [Cinchona calisaya]|uniref:Flavin-containing monooxygenase n=1 Tax=Cinchona calisaya TaxID=153742 RepID=A0ABD3B0E6_9GENT